MPDNTNYPEIQKLVPHKPPMLLVDRAIYVDDTRAHVEVTITPNTRFLRNGKVRAVVGLEYMAQCIAVHFGWANYQKGASPELGYLLGARTLDLQVGHFNLGDRLDIQAEHTWGDTRSGSYACVVRRGDEVLVSGNLNVFTPRPGDEGVPHS